MQKQSIRTDCIRLPPKPLVALFVSSHVRTALNACGCVGLVQSLTRPESNKPWLLKRALMANPEVFPFGLTVKASRPEQTRTHAIADKHTRITTRRLADLVTTCDCSGTEIACLSRSHRLIFLNLLPASSVNFSSPLPTLLLRLFILAQSLNCDGQTAPTTSCPEFENGLRS
ncbi:unnamed protein product [Protopolystoma xenopodis]|uniref:Uncharacterized protein n=1 Tax=Protopolystoma xenopodis TaxID=117903 RepID=A0A3S5B2I9_9PLAT|nr:unnamed protein product [Protopolystoma xenopodis]